MDSSEEMLWKDMGEHKGERETHDGEAITHKLILRGQHFFLVFCFPKKMETLPYLFDSTCACWSVSE